MEDDLEKARKWSRQAKRISLTALAISVLTFLFKVILLIWP